MSVPLASPQPNHSRSVRQPAGASTHTITSDRARCVMGQATRGQQVGAGGAAELFRLAWPFILSNSLWTLQIALDRILLSRASTDSVGAAMAPALLFWGPITLRED